jgi:hypothetical protein
MLRFFEKRRRIVALSALLFIIIPQEEDVTFAHSTAYFSISVK